MKPLMVIIILFMLAVGLPLQAGECKFDVDKDNKIIPGTFEGNHSVCIDWHTRVDESIYRGSKRLAKALAKGVAASAALSAIPTVVPGDGKFALSVGGGHVDSETKLAIGFAARPTEAGKLHLNGAVSRAVGETIGRAGMTLVW